MSRAVKANEISLVEPLNHCVLLDNPKTTKRLGLLSQPHFLMAASLGLLLALLLKTEGFISA
ncbi:hypothetical protein STRDD13_00427 [Streptococcus sp. DD13]|nr:hypothetical protein STRDD13_00427 [Streptococcus sp. DD13]